MVHYFLAFGLLLVPALVWTLVTGLSHDTSDAHFDAGLFTAVLALTVHTLLILFMIVTGRVLKEAMRSRPLGPEFLQELNAFFAQQSTYPVALFACFSIVAAAVLGNGQRGFGLSSVWHVAVGAGAILLNLWALLIEHRALRTNQRLLDRAAQELDRLDREAGTPAVEEPARPGQAARFGLILCVSAWFPYLYWALIHWRGDFSRVSLHPWIEASAFGLLVWWLARSAPEHQPRA